MSLHRCNPDMLPPLSPLAINKQNSVKHSHCNKMDSMNVYHAAHVLYMKALVGVHEKQAHENIAPWHYYW